MKTLLMASGLMMAGVLAVGAGPSALAANATHPYQNCDKKVDNCGPTGNETTDQLNSQQLGGSPTMPAPSDTQPPMQGTMAPRQ